MSCLDLQAYNEFSVRLAKKALEEHVPCFGMFELTYRCNLDCVHCYISDRQSRDELSHDEVTRILDEIVAEGCFSLLFTGGEPFLRPDFEEIFAYAKRKGIIAYIFTNGAHIPEKYFRLFKRLKPSLIDISLYGAGEPAYERTTGRRAFARVMRNIRRLQDIGVRVKVKSTLLRTNAADYTKLVALHEKLGLDVRLNMQMTHAYDGSARPADYRLAPQEIIRLEAGSEAYAAEWRRAFAARPPDDNGVDSLYHCGAGTNSFCITPFGQLKICGTIQKYAIDLRRESFKSAWARLLRPFQDLRKRADHPCRSCRLTRWCLQCPAWADLDMGDEQAVVPYVCETTRLRAREFSAFQTLVSRKGGVCYEESVRETASHRD